MGAFESSASRDGRWDRSRLSRERDKLAPGEKDIVAAQLSRTLGALTRRRRLSVLTSGNLGSKDSAHDVFFIKPDSDGKPGDPTFACKRFRKYDNAARELDAIDMAKERGFRTLEPAKMPLHEVDGIGHILVTHQLPRFSTLNQVGWQDSYAGDVTYESRIAAPLRSASKFVANMHRHGITHGDMQLKNLGQIPPGRFVLFDLEGAQFVDPQAAAEDLDFQDRAIADVGTMVVSLVDRGYMWSSSDRMFAEEVTRNVFDPYLEVSANTNPEIVERFESILDEAKLERQHVHPQMAQHVYRQPAMVG
ncbi:MAG: Lipopolysaccharide kinase (Kdo/WaaP) family [Candidatus Saccharibacteria bacterium]|nr:Lipopolysaccharide kinase (Kdo/WaaP) family [Candidatus Saccharibacteria bacterium]